MTDDIVYRLRMPLPYNLAGMTTTQLGDERRQAADEIERLRKRMTELLETNDELRAQMRSWQMVAEKFDAFNEHGHNDNCGYGSCLTGQTNCYCGRSMYEQTKAALDD